MQNGTNEVETLKKEIEILKKDLLKLNNSLEKVVSTTVESKFEKIKESISDKIPKEDLENIKQKAQESAKLIKTKYEEYPMVALLLAAGIGYLIGKSAKK